MDGNKLRVIRSREVNSAYAISPWTHRLIIAGQETRDVGGRKGKDFKSKQGAVARVGLKKARKERHSSARCLSSGVCSTAIRLSR